MKNLEVLLDMLEKCESVEQNLNHHPEGNVLNHSLQVFKHAIRESNDFELILAALLHVRNRSWSLRQLLHFLYRNDMKYNI